MKDTYCFWCGKLIYRGGTSRRVGKTGRAPLRTYHKECWRQAKASLPSSRK